MPALWVALVIFIIISAATVAGFKAYEYTGTPEFCVSCHQMETKYASWQNSEHAEVRCMACHSSPEKYGELIAHLRGSRYVYTYLTGWYTRPVIKAEPDSPARREACLACHSEMSLVKGEEAKLLAGKTAQTHTMHRDLKLQCTECHANLVHGKFEPVAAKPKSELCVACHTSRGVWWFPEVAENSRQY